MIPFRARRYQRRKRPLLLDNFPALAAFSLWRKLRDGYSGPAFKVRRSSDSAELDIYFAGAFVDLAALAVFCAGTSGFIKTVYDQGTAGRNIAMATTANQPRIYNAGTLDKLGSLSSGCVLDGSNDLFTRADVFGLTGASPACTIAFTASISNTSTVVYRLGGNAARTGIGLFNLSGAGLSIDYSNTSLPFNSPSPAKTTAAAWVQTHASGGNANTGGLRQNGVALTAGSPTDSGALNFSTISPSGIGALNAGGFNTAMKLNSWMIFDSVLTGTPLAALDLELAAHLV